jgi:hypothetical protein
MKTVLHIHRSRLISLEKHEQFRVRRRLGWVKVEQISVDWIACSLIGRNEGGDLIEFGGDLRPPTPDRHPRLPETVRNEINRCLQANEKMPRYEDIEEA